MLRVHTHSNTLAHSNTNTHTHNRTGADTGISLETARELAHAGALFVLTCRSLARDKCTADAENIRALVGVGVQNRFISRLICSHVLGGRGKPFATLGASFGGRPTLNVRRPFHPLGRAVINTHQTHITRTDELECVGGREREHRGLIIVISPAEATWRTVPRTAAAAIGRRCRAYRHRPNHWYLPYRAADHTYRSQKLVS